MENQPRAPLPGSDPDKSNTPAVPTPSPAALANFDFDKELDQGPTKPGPLMHQQSSKSGNTPGRKKSAKTFVMVLLTILLLAAIGAAGYFYWQTTDVQKQADSANRQVTALTTENAKLKSDAKKADDTSDKVVTPSDADQAKLAAIQYICAGTASCAGVKTETPKMSAKNDFAKVTVLLTSGQISSQTVVYTKRVQTSETSWVAFYGTQNGIPKSTVDKYSIPADFLSAGEVQP